MKFVFAILMPPLVALALAGCSSNNDSSAISSSVTSGGNAEEVCSVASPCSSGDCIYQPGTCQAGATGFCVNYSTCDGPARGPGCGCDGKTIEGTYGACGLAAPYDNASGCQVGTFACGPALMCKRNSEMCVKTVAATTSYECKPYMKMEDSFPCVSGIPDCSCIHLESFGASDKVSCAADADYQETITVQN